jgi:hypothetical protein
MCNQNYKSEAPFKNGRMRKLKKNLKQQKLKIDASSFRQSKVEERAEY